MTYWHCVIIAALALIPLGSIAAAFLANRSLLFAGGVMLGAGLAFILFSVVLVISK